MTTLHQLNECLLFSSDAAGHLLSLDIDLYFNGANTTENNKSITDWGHVSQEHLELYWRIHSFQRKVFIIL